MMNCKEVSRLMSERRDHPLPLRQRVGLRLHLAMCKLCRIVGDQLEFLSRLSKKAGDTADESYLARYGFSQETLSPEVKDRIKQQLSKNL